VKGMHEWRQVQHAWTIVCAVSSPVKRLRLRQRLLRLDVSASCRCSCAWRRRAGRKSAMAAMVARARATRRRSWAGRSWSCHRCLGWEGRVTQCACIVLPPYDSASSCIHALALLLHMRPCSFCYRPVVTVRPWTSSNPDHPPGPSRRSSRKPHAPCRQRSIGTPSVHRLVSLHHNTCSSRAEALVTSGPRACVASPGSFAVLFALCPQAQLAVYADH
jgi:hypothetical protein